MQSLSCNGNIAEETGSSLFYEWLNFDKNEELLLLRKEANNVWLRNTAKLASWL